jgi:hypothetical protein
LCQTLVVGKAVQEAYTESDACQLDALGTSQAELPHLSYPSFHLDLLQLALKAKK